MSANQVICGTSAFTDAPLTLPAVFAGESADSSPVGLWSENWGNPDGRYRNI
jgi:hypothetical protein